ncbi:hypothetical protein DPSP01_005739 [Paraphaeosphaeria sporulosa]
MPLLSKPVNALVVLLSALGVVNAAPVPTPNEAVPVPNPKDIPEGVHYWPIDDAEADRLSKLLNIDFRSLNILGTFVKAPKATCEGCGKRSGLEDFVDNALKANIHTREWMVDVLKKGGHNASPAHDLQCANCETKFERRDLEDVAKRDDPGFQWASNFNWIFGRDPEAVAEAAAEAAKRDDPGFQWASNFNWIFGREAAEAAEAVKRDDPGFQWASNFNWIFGREAAEAAEAVKRDDPGFQWASNFNWIFGREATEAAAAAAKRDDPGFQWASNFNWIFGREAAEAATAKAEMAKRDDPGFQWASNFNWIFGREAAAAAKRDASSPQ